MEPACIWNHTAAIEVAREVAKNCSREVDYCTQFCHSFRDVLPFTYLGISLVSAVCCVLVFFTYLCMPRLRQTGYSSKVFLNRCVSIANRNTIP